MNAPVKHIPRKKWNTASHDQIDAYKSLLDDKLSAIDISKGVFKGGGGFRGFKPPPPENFRFFFER